MTIPSTLIVGGGASSGSSSLNDLLLRYSNGCNILGLKESNHLFLRNLGQLILEKLDTDSSVTDESVYLKYNETGKYRIDASPLYMYFDDMVPTSILEIWPPESLPKVIFIVRNPIKRSCSSLAMLRNYYGFDSLNFSELRKWWLQEGSLNPFDCSLHPRLPNFVFDCVGHSVFWKKIPNFIKKLGEDHVRIYTLDQLISCPGDVINNIANFASIDLSDDSQVFDSNCITLNHKGQKYKVDWLSRYIVHTRKPQYIRSFTSLPGIDKLVKRSKEKYSKILSRMRKGSSSAANFDLEEYEQVCEEFTGWEAEVDSSNLQSLVGCINSSELKA